MKVDEKLSDDHDLQYEKHQCRFSGRAPFKNRTSQKILAILVKDKVKLILLSIHTFVPQKYDKNTIFHKNTFHVTNIHWSTLQDDNRIGRDEDKINVYSLTKTDQKTLLCYKLTHVPR